MAMIAFPAVGAAIGYGITTAWALPLAVASALPSIGWALGSMAYGLVKGSPDLPPVIGPQLADTKITSSAYGEFVLWVFGRAPVGGNVIAASDWVNIPTYSVVETGGKGGGGGEQIHVTYHQEATLAVLICDCRRQGPIAGIRRIKANGRVIRDVGSTAAPAAVLGSDPNIIIYTGTDTQTPDANLEALAGTGRTPAYRYSAYVVFTQFNRDNFGRFECEVVRAGSTSTMQPVEMFDLPGGELISNDIPDAAYNVRQVTAGGEFTWVIVDVAGNPRKIALVNNFDGSYLASNTGSGNMSLMGLGWNRRAIYQEDGVGIQFIDTSGRVRRQALPSTFGVGGNSPNRLHQCYEDTTRQDRENEVDLYIQYNPTTASVRKIYYNSGYNLGVEGGGASETELTFVNTNANFAWNAAGIADRLYVTSVAGLDANRSRVSYITMGTATVTDVVVFNSLAIGTQMLCLVGNDGYLYVIGAGETTLEKYTSDGVLVDSVTVPTATSGSLLAQDADGNLYYQSDTDLRRINTGTMEVELSSTIGSNFSIVAGVDAFMGRGVIATRIPSAPDQGTIYEVDGIPRIADTTADLGTDMVETICLECGYDASDFDVSDITGITMDGATIPARVTGRAAIEQWMGIKFFGAVESDDEIKFIRHNNDSIVTIPATELAARVAGDAMPDEITITRRQELDLAAEVSFTYFSRDNDYTIATQAAKNTATTSQKKLALSASVVLSDDDARQVVETVRDSIWAEREAFVFSTGRKYAKYEPLDVVTLPHNGRDIEARLTRRLHGANGVMRFEALPQATEILTQYAAGTIPQVSIPGLTPIGPTEAFFIDIPLLRDVDDDAGFYCGMRGLAAGWNGAQLYQSKDGGVSYPAVENGTILTASGIGRALTALADPGDELLDLFDENSTVSVYLPGYTLVSYTKAQILAGLATPVLVGGEIILYRTATLTATDTYTLSGLLRARRGTESHMTHAAGERVAVLDANLRTIMGTMADANRSYLYKAVSVGSTLTRTTALGFLNTALRLKPLAPCHLKAGISSAGGDVTISWQRRTRFNNPWIDGVDAPLGESSESYIVTIYAFDGSTAVRSETVAEPSYTYAIADQVSDFGAAQPSYLVGVRQVSEEYGHGHEALEAVMAAEARYWKFTNFVCISGPQLGEIEVRDVTGAIQTSATASVSPALHASSASVAEINDGNLGSNDCWWGAHSASNQFTLDFGVAKRLYSVRLGHFFDPGSDWFPTEMDVYVSNDGVNFTLRSTVTGIVNPANNSYADYFGL